MMRNPRSLIILLAFVSIGIAEGLAQPLTEIPYRFKLEGADSAFANFDYYNAVDWYEQCYKETRELELAERIAYCHWKMRDYRRAERWYKRVVDKDENQLFPLVPLEYGRMLKLNGKYEEARAQFAGLDTQVVGDSIKAIADLEIAGIDLAETLKSPYDLVVDNAGSKLNGRYTESSPSISPEGELHYISFEEDKLITLKGKSEDYHSKIFKSKRNDSGTWQKGKAIDDRVNRPGFHSSHVSFSKDGERMYMTRAIVKGGKTTLSQLYYCDKRGGSWGAPQTMSEVNQEYLNMHPAEARFLGGDVLLFASERPGGYGGLDLYYAPINRDGGFGLPVNLGPEINTAGDEVTPSYGEDVLYFSSNGHPSLGGFDIYKSDWNGQVFAPVENMGKGFNSAVDDLYFTLGGEDSGFLVSNRDGTRSVKSKTCCDDIFTFAKKDIIIRLLATVLEDGEEEKPLNGATIKLFTKIAEDLSLPDVQKNEEGNEFDFALNEDKAYQVLVEREGYYPDTADFNTVGVRESKNFRGTFKLKPIPKLDKPDMEILTRNEPIRLSNIYYDLDDDQILPDAEEDLDFVYGLLKKYPDMVIELSSHTDSRGPDPYNQNLSQRRAESAVRYLELRGIDRSRMKPVGYGEERILNRCVNGVKCSEADHRSNRRTEFTIIEGPQTIEVPVDGTKGAAQPQEEKQDDGGSAALTPPVLKFDSPEVDLGTVKKGEIKSYDFHFTNVGGSDLIIDQVTGCDCTTLDWPRLPIKPGEEGIIEMNYDSSEKEPGEDEVTVDVFANTQPLVTQATFKLVVEP